MQACRAILLLVFTWAVLVLPAAGQEQADPVKQQKEKAQANWKRAFEKSPFLHVETANLLIYASPTLTEKRIKDCSGVLETELGFVRKAVAVDPKKPLWPGKLTVFLLDDRRLLNSFIRVVEKRRPEGGELGSHVFMGEEPHIAATAPPTPRDLTLEAQAGEQLASVALKAKEGENSGIPEWLVLGFARASIWRTLATPVARKQREVERQRALAVMTLNKRSVKDLWGNSLGDDELPYLRAGIADFLAYGPYADRFPQFMKAFKPEENTTKSMDDILESIKMSPERMDREVPAWLRQGGK